MLGTTTVMRILGAVLVMSACKVAGAGILDADTLKKGAYRSASFSVW